MTVSRDDIIQFCHEQFASPPDLFVLERFTASGQQAVVHSATSKGPTAAWAPEAIGATMESVASRDARGLPGVVQYQISVFRDGNLKSAAAVLPFQRVGALLHGPLPNGGLGGEVSTPTGIMDTGRRWGELAVQQAGAMQLHLWSTLVGELRSLRENNVALFAEAREGFVALRTLAVNSANADTDRLAKLMVSRRNYMLSKEGIKMLPGALNAFSGEQIFPIEQSDAHSYRALLRHLGDDELKALAASAEKKGPAAQTMLATMVSRAAQLRKEEQDEESKLRELEEQELGMSSDDHVMNPRETLERAVGAMEQAARDAAGEPPRQLANGNGHADGHATLEQDEASDAIAAFGEQFGELSDSEVSMIAGMARMKGRGALADSMLAAHRAVRQKREVP